MPTVFATLKVHAEKADEAKKLFGQLQEHVRSTEPGNLAYIVHQRSDDPSVFMVYEKYASDEAFAEHRKNLANSPVDLGAIIAAPPEITVTEEI